MHLWEPFAAIVNYKPSPTPKGSPLPSPPEESNSVLVFVCGGLNDCNAASKQSRIHRIGSRAKQRKRRSVEYLENINKAACIVANQQVDNGECACSRRQKRRQEANTQRDGDQCGTCEEEMVRKHVAIRGAHHESSSHRYSQEQSQNLAIPQETWKTVVA